MGASSAIHVASTMTTESIPNSYWLLQARPLPGTNSTNGDSTANALAMRRVHNLGMPKLNHSAIFRAVQVAEQEDLTLELV